jgi:hypothetical protein
MSGALGVISSLAASQWGLLTTAQAEKVGVTRLTLSRMVAAEVLERPSQGVYVLAGAVDEFTDLRAAWLSLMPAMTAEERLASPADHGVASHATAANLHHLGDLKDDLAEFTFAVPRRTRRDGIRLHQAALASNDVTIAAGLPVTTVERTIADLLVDSTADVQHIADITGQALADGKLSPGALAYHLDPVAAHWGKPTGAAAVSWLLNLAGYNSQATAMALESSAEGQRVLQHTLVKVIRENPEWIAPELRRKFADLRESLLKSIEGSAIAEAQRSTAQFKKVTSGARPPTSKMPIASINVIAKHSESSAAFIALLQQAAALAAFTPNTPISPSEDQ